MKILPEKNARWARRAVSARSPSECARQKKAHGRSNRSWAFLPDFSLASLAAEIVKSVRLSCVRVFTCA